MNFLLMSVCEYGRFLEQNHWVLIVIVKGKLVQKAKDN